MVGEGTHGEEEDSPLSREPDLTRLDPRTWRSQSEAKADSRMSHSGAPVFVFSLSKLSIFKKCLILVRIT